MNYLTNYYKNLSEQLQERVDHLKKLLSESEVTASEMAYPDYQKLIKHLQSQGAPASKIAEVEADMVAAGARHGLNIKPQSTSTKIPSPKVGTVSNAAKGLGAGIVGGLVGEYMVKPAAEKAGVFKAVESGTRAALSNTPDWVAKVADPVLGTARFALDPIGTTSEFLEKEARMSSPITKAERDRATERFERKDY